MAWPPPGIRSHAPIGGRRVVSASCSLALRARKGCHAQALHFLLHFVRNISRLRARTKVIAAFLQPVLYFLIRYQQTSYVLPPFLVPFLWLLVLFPVGGELSFHLILF